jgi:peptidoglycan/LPS O-acetylase OafA/YrhL
MAQAVVDSEFTRYRPDIDGLRAVAVLAVVFYHAFPQALTGGFVGVDIFFVISGYLISGNILKHLDTGQFSFQDFYGRRIRRIFPALILVLALCLIYGFVVLLPVELAQLGTDTAGGAGFVSNILLWNQAGYFDRAALNKPLLHLWSLGVEEQFYIFWPLVLWLLYRARSGRLAFFITITIASLCLGIVLSSDHITADFYSPFTRFWELSSGAILAWLQLHPSSSLQKIAPLRSAASIAGLILIIGCTLLLNPLMRFPGWLALLPVAGAIALIGAGPRAVVNRAVLSNRVAVFIGIISYPLYLWHWPLISYAHIISLDRPLKNFLCILLIAASVILAWLTYIVIERPVRFGRHRSRNTAVLIGLMVLVGVSGVSTWAAQGFPARYPNLPDLSVSVINGAIGDGIFKPTISMRVINIHETYIAKIGNGDEKILFIGDSLVYQYGPRVQALLDQGRLKKTVYFVVGAACPPIPNVFKAGAFAHCSQLPGIAQNVMAAQGINTIVMGGYWQGNNGYDTYVERAGVRLPMNNPLAANLFFANLEDEVSHLIQTHHKVYLILCDPLNVHFDPSHMIKRSVIGVSIAPDVFNDVPMADLQANIAKSNQKLLAIAARTGAIPLNPLADICGAGPGCSAFFDGGQPKHADDLHLRPAFVKDHMTFLDGILMQ